MNSQDFRALVPSICVMVAPFLVDGAYGQAVIPLSNSTIVKAETPSPSAQRFSATSNIASTFQKAGPLFAWSVFEVRPSISYSLIYSDGLLTASGRVTSVLQTISPGVLVNAGKHWTLDYMLRKTIYSTHLLSDTVDHNGSLSCKYSIGDWVFGGSQTVGYNTPTLIETGRQTREETYSTTINNSYQLSDRILLEATLTRSQRYADAESEQPIDQPIAWTGADWLQTSLSSWVRYRVSERVNVGIGLLVGKDEVTENPDMEYYKPQGGISWRPTNKLSFSFDGGTETRKARVPGGKKFSNFVYSGSAHYQPRQTTGVSASVNQNISTSYFANQSTQNTTWNINLEQSVLQRYFVALGYSKGSTTYIASTEQAIFPRDDRFSSYNGQISTPVLRRGSVSVSYSVSKNQSNLTGFAFTSHQTGFHFSYRF
jgi:hypothetical protein